MILGLSMLTEPEKQWVNAYHAEVMDKTKGYFEKDDRTRAWLERECALY